MNTHGGKRAGAGRPKGSVNKRSLGLREKMETSGLDPVEFLISVVQDESHDIAVRKDAAKSLLPYAYPRLASQSIELTSENSFDAIEHKSFKEMTCDELSASIMRSAALILSGDKGDAMAKQLQITVEKAMLELLASEQEAPVVSECSR